MLLDYNMNLWYQNFENNLCLGQPKYFDGNQLICNLINILKTRMNLTNQWNEDIITAFLLENLMSFYDSFSNISVHIYKQIGKEESFFGDIAIIVTFSLENNIFQGVSFIEAKRDFPDKKYKFASFNKFQLEKITQHTTSSFYIFYSHKYFLPMINSFCLRNIIEIKNIQNGSLQIEDIYDFTTTFPTQFSRFLKGFDLDYSDKAFSIISEGNKPKYLIKININFVKNNKLSIKKSKIFFDPIQHNYEILSKENLQKLLKKEEK